MHKYRATMGAYVDRNIMKAETGTNLEQALPHSIFVEEELLRPFSATLVEDRLAWDTHAKDFICRGTAAHDLLHHAGQASTIDPVKNPLFLGFGFEKHYHCIRNLEFISQGFFTLA